MTAQLGVSIDGRGAAVPSAVKAAGASWLRLVLLPDRDTRHLVSLYQSVGLQVCGVVARESVAAFGVHDALTTWDRAADEYRKRVGTILDAIQTGNEPDHESPSSWTLPASRVNDLARAFWGFKRRIGPGLASGHPEYAAGLGVGLFDALAVHPYGRAPTRDWPHMPNFGYVGDLLAQYQAYHPSLWVTEYGTDDQAHQAKYVAEMTRTLRDHPAVEAAFHFCWSDRSGVAPFGLLDLNDRTKAAHAKFYEATHEEDNDMAITEDAAKQQAYQDLFQAGKSLSSKIAFNPDAALVKHFLEHPAEMGSAVGPERHATDAAGGTTAVFQAYARGVWVWRPASGVQAA
jgi:hypothetical protein